MSNNGPELIEILATLCFVGAVLHTFLSNQFQKWAHQYPEGSIKENFWHLLGEVEVVFGLWASLFIVLFSLVSSPKDAMGYVDQLHFTEPLFVFVIMATAATRPILECARSLIFTFAKIISFGKNGSEPFILFSCLSLGPLLGSLITEPAAMTLTALILKQRYYNGTTSLRLKYIVLGTLFVNISIGGALTPFAAPPILMVAGKWDWDIQFMLTTFGWRASVATVINALAAVWFLRRELKSLGPAPVGSTAMPVPSWLKSTHILFLGLIVLTAHHPAVFIGIFLLFLGVTAITAEFQTQLPLRQSLLVAFFLGGLVVLGGFQQWWLSPVLQNLPEAALFLGTTALTAITDNAALTYLGSQLPTVTDAFKYSLVAGAITGGGLTVIANAPNPAGFSILQPGFGENGIEPLKLLSSALLPTIVSALCLWPYGN